MLDKEGGSSRGCLDPGVCHIIKYRLVTFVSDACHHGNGELCDDGCQQITVKVAQVSCGTTSAYDDHYIPLGVLVGHSLQGSRHRLFHTGSLHDGREESYVESQSIVVVCHLIAEISIAGGSFCRDDSYA